MMKNTYKRGFTLIELLVVIAIIGILASVVLASLNTARDKGADAAVKSDLANIRSQMELYHDDNNNAYTDACTTSINVADGFTAAKSAVSGVVNFGGFGDGECITTDTEWAVWVNLKSASTSAWCIDSTGKSDYIVSQDSSAVDLTACP